MNIKKNKKAFSLTELSVAILLISLLIAGIISSSSLYEKHVISSARKMTRTSPVISIEGLSLWLDSTATDSFIYKRPENNSYLQYWYDINPQKIDKITFVQNTANKQPQYKSKIINHLPAIKFDSANSSYLESSESFDSSRVFNENEIMIFLVQQHISGDTSTISWSDYVGSNEYVFNISATDSGNVVFDFGDCCDANSTKTDSVSNFSDDPKILAFKKDSAGNYQLRINGSEISSSTSINDSILQDYSSKIYLGSRYNDSSTSFSKYFNGYIGEVIIFENAITENEMQEIELYLSKKWRIPLS